MRANTAVGGYATSDCCFFGIISIFCQGVTLNVVLHSVELCNINIQANRPIQSVVPISTKWDHRDIREGSYTGSGEGNKTIKRFFKSSFHALYSAVENDTFLTRKTTDLNFQEMILHIKWPGSSNWLQGRLRNWSSLKALLSTCWLHRAHLPKALRCLGKAVEGLQEHPSGEKPWGFTCSNQSHALSEQWVGDTSEPQKSPGLHLSVLIACQTLRNFVFLYYFPLLHWNQ